MPAPDRAGGLAAVVTWTQLPPSYSQVSAGMRGRPPNSTVRPRARSLASEWSQRAGGAAVVTTCIQLTPSYSQVSARPVRLGAMPPNITVRPRAASNVAAANDRGGGEVSVCTGDQAVAYSQVSVGNDTDVEKQCGSATPPNNTVRPRQVSCTSTWPSRRGGARTARASR